MSVNEPTGRLVLFLTMPKSECLTERSERVAAALRHKARGDVSLVASEELWAEAAAATEEMMTGRLDSSDQPSPSKSTRAIDRAYRERLYSLFGHCAGLIVLPRADGTIGNGVKLEIAAAIRRDVRVRIVAPDGRLVALADAEMVTLASCDLMTAARFDIWKNASVLSPTDSCAGALPPL